MQPASLAVGKREKQTTPSGAKEGLLMHPTPGSNLLFSSLRLTCPLEMRLTPFAAIVNECGSICSQRVSRNPCRQMLDPKPHARNARFVSGHRFSDAATATSSTAPSGAVGRNRTRNPPNALVDFPSKRDNIRLRQSDAHVTEVSPTRLSGQREKRRAPKAIP